MLERKKAEKPKEITFTKEDMLDRLNLKITHPDSHLSPKEVEETKALIEAIKERGLDALQE